MVFINFIVSCQNSRSHEGLLTTPVFSDASRMHFYTFFFGAQIYDYNIRLLISVRLSIDNGGLPSEPHLNGIRDLFLILRQTFNFTSNPRHLDWWITGVSWIVHGCRRI